MGVMDREVNKEASRVAATTKASCLKITPTKPLKKIMGRKMTTVVRVEAVMAMPIWEAPCMAAGPGRAPRSTWRTIFSSTTMALSTTMPEAMARAMRVTVLML